MYSLFRDNSEVPDLFFFLFTVISDLTKLVPLIKGAESRGSFWGGSFNLTIDC